MLASVVRCVLDRLAVQLGVGSKSKQRCLFSTIISINLGHHIKLKNTVHLSMCRKLLMYSTYKCRKPEFRICCYFVLELGYWTWCTLLFSRHGRFLEQGMNTDLVRASVYSSLYTPLIRFIFSQFCIFIPPFTHCPLYHPLLMFCILCHQSAGDV